MDISTGVTMRVLGAARIDGVATPLGPKQSMLLGALVLRDGRVSSDVMVDLLWGDQPPENPRAALQIHVSRLRRALDHVGASVQFQGDGYRLLADRRRIDVGRFERLVDDGATLLAADPSGAHAHLMAALSLWQGPPLDGAADETSLRADVQRLRETHLVAVTSLADAALALGRHAELIPQLQQLTEEHPFHDGLRSLLLLALYRSGRAGEALASYEAARVFMAEEMGVDPAPELRELHRRMLEHDPTLVRPEPAPTLVIQEPRRVDPASVAVLPFEVLGDVAEAAETELVAAGLHIDLLTELSRVERLTVTSRHSVLAYAIGAQPPERVARELGVANVLVGSIRAAADRFRLSVQLLDADAGVHVWAESYDHQLQPHNVLAVQRDLAADIAAALSRRLTPSTSASSTDNMDAYRLVVEGRMQFDRKTEEGLAVAVALCRRAVVLDPDYGLAWARLAAALAMTADYGYGDQQALVSDAESAVVRAMALCPGSAEVHEVLGVIAEVRNDAPRALREFDRAISISPGNADAHSWRAWMHLTLGAADEALDSARRAVALNPLSAEAVSNLALSLTASGEPAEGLDEARRADRLSPGYTTAHYYAGLALCDLGRFDEAIQTLGPLSVETSGELTVPWAGMAPDAALAVAQVATGDIDGARATSRSVDAEIYPVEAGLIEAALGNSERAATHFTSAVRIGYGGAMLRHHHFRQLWADLDGDPRLCELDARIARSWKVERSPA